MYDFYTIILYGIMLNLCQSWLLKLDIACHCSLFGSFGKYRNRTESTDTEFPRYRVSAGTDRYRLTEEPNLYGYRRTEPIGSVLPNAQGDSQRTPCSNTGHEVPGPRVVSQCARSRRRRGEGADPRPDPYTGRDTSEHEVKRTQSKSRLAGSQIAVRLTRACSFFYHFTPARAGLSG